jgi:gas vesicle protein
MKTINKILIAFGAGAAIGGVLGVLFAPKKGTELRKDISDKGRKISEDFQATFNKGKEKLNRYRKEVEEVTEDFA